MVQASLQAVRFIRKMRGGAQAHLLEANDGHFYVVKFLNNPQHRRILINELFSYRLLRYLEIATPHVCIIELTSEFLKSNPEVFIQLGRHKLEVPVGWHLASQFPGNPDRDLVFDFLPDSLLGEVVNSRDFLGILCFDRWVSNADGRQAIFCRTTRPRRSGNLSKGFIGLMIDQGFAFYGPHWELPDLPLAGLYHRPLIYRDVTGLASFSPWLERIADFPPEVFDEAYASIPMEWFDNDRDVFEDLLEKLYRRRKKLTSLLKATVRAKPEFFPNWRGCPL